MLSLPRRCLGPADEHASEEEHLGGDSLLDGSGGTVGGPFASPADPRGPRSGDNGGKEGEMELTFC